MLPAESFVVWFLSLYIVTVTRDFSAALVQSAFIFSAVYIVTQTGDPSDDEIFTLSVRRPAYGLYGGIAGYGLAAALRCRTLVPIHSFSNVAVHLPGPLILVGISYGIYTLITASGLSTLEHDDTPLADPLEVAILATTFVILALGVILVLTCSCLGWPTIFTFKYRDMDSRKDPVLPSSRLAAESVFLSIAVFAPTALWINLPKDPVNWPQWGAGLLAIPLSLGGFVLMYFVLKTRHAMDRVHFDADHARVTWRTFMIVLSSVFGISASVWLIVAEFSTSEFAAEMTLLGLSLLVLICAAVIAFIPAGIWRKRALPIIEAYIPPAHENWAPVSSNTFAALSHEMEQQDEWSSS